MMVSIISLINFDLITLSLHLNNIFYIHVQGEKRQMKVEIACKWNSMKL